MLSEKKNRSTKVMLKTLQESYLLPPIVELKLFIFFISTAN